MPRRFPRRFPPVATPGRDTTLFAEQKQEKVGSIQAGVGGKIEAILNEAPRAAWQRAWKS